MSYDELLLSSENNKAEAQEYVNIFVDKHSRHLKVPEMNGDEITARVKALKVGHSFTVDDDAQRRAALNAARVLSLRIVTRKAKNGFTVTRLPE